MKKLLGYSICAFGSALLLVAVTSHLWVRNDVADHQSAKHSENRLNIRFSEQTVRLEPVNSGDTSSGTIFVENTGNKIITNVTVKAGCWCSDVNLSATAISPGETIRIDFFIDTKGKYEDFTDNFIVTYSEDTKNLFDVFYATVPILASGKLIAEPASLQFSRARADESFIGNITLRVKDLPDNETVDIIDLSVPDWMTADLMRKDTHWELALTGEFPNQSGRYVEFVRIQSSSERYSEMVVPVIVEYATVSSGDSDVYQ